ncbi:hypothetical protein BEV13_02065, partial [Rickettsiella grylli]
IKETNVELFNCIQKIKLQKKPNFIKVVYPYGSTLVNNGELSVYSYVKKTNVSISLVNSSLKDKLSYASVPLGLLLNKAIEVYCPFNKNRVIPLKLLMPGQLFGLQEIMQTIYDYKEKPNFSINSGARSIFLVPKIANKGGYSRLKKYLNMQLDPPISLSDHWGIFTSISNHPNYINQWNNQVLFFTKSWFEEVNCTNPNWFPFFNFLSKAYHNQLTPGYSNFYNFELTWQEFMTAIGCRNLKPRPYILSTAKHLLAIAVGLLPGFSSANLEQIIAPTKILKEIFIDIYKLKYLPTIMHPSYFNIQKNTPLYYSLSFPSILEGLPMNKEPRDILTDQRELKILFDTIKNNSSHYKQKFPRICQLFDTVNYNFYHNNIDAYKEIGIALEITKGASDLLWDQSLFPNKDFCYTSSFLNGCIKISKK